MMENRTGVMFVVRDKKGREWLEVATFSISRTKAKVKLDVLNSYRRNNHVPLLRPSALVAVEINILEEIRKESAEKYYPRAVLAPDQDYPQETNS